MTWTLKSGRVMQTEARSLCFDYSGDFDQAGEEGAGWFCIPPCHTGRKGGVPGVPLTPAERREIAEAVKAAWDAWARSGE